MLLDLPISDIDTVRDRDKISHCDVELTTVSKELATQLLLAGYYLLISICSIAFPRWQIFIF